MLDVLFPHFPRGNEENRLGSEDVIFELRIYLHIYILYMDIYSEIYRLS
jgi:hypothetical protein